MARDKLGTILTPGHYDTSRENFGNTSAGGGAGTTVPEPGTWLMVMCLLAGATVVRRR